MNNLPMDQTGNNFNNTNTIVPTPQNNTFEFYLPLPNDTRIYYVTYTELNSTEIARLLNNRIDLSYIPDHQLPYHYNVHRLIREEIGQQSVGYQQNTISQQSFDTMIIQPNFQEYSDNNAYDVSSSIPQDAIPQQSFNTMDIQPTFQEYSNNNAYNTSPISSNSPEDNSSYNGVQLYQNNQ
ncbi:unnamed protein product [Rhizophagus irregularis]|uniref:Uncharacterized protein n=1 Tax=Rhizophagus irregularis TaxID=588596 RepID=A0A2N1N9Q8_9GLOM|nr:hypothetical protein RhiirC2_829669 [Rhizophagus irregularis]CAB4373336.1 unnamed protein product [Rhizophagus irregularis]CAB5357129.1 unnamed protein product [Rhizophagus irregularis]